MNFLEGLRRLIIIAGALLTIFVGVIAWEGFYPLKCWASASPPTEFSAWHMDWEKFPGAKPKEVELKPTDPAATGVVPPSDLPERANVRLKEVDFDPFIAKSIAEPMTYGICEPELKYFAKRSGATVGWTAATIASVWFFWMLLRWALIGFFPAWGRKEIAKNEP